jgi:glyoxylase-like metal-dependent hydrolase (beta-lactamase superfamily II)
MSDVRVSFLEAGFTKHLEAISLAGGRLKTIRFPATVAVIEHSKHGVVLFDTGYSMRFYEQTKYFPNRFYGMITPVTITPETSALYQLKSRGIGERDIKHVVLSHFHADHIGGAADFAHAQYIYRQNAYGAVRSLSSLRSVRAGFLRGLLPSDFERRSRCLTDSDFVVGKADCAGFESGCDLFGDGSVVALDLPGHAIGQLGLLVKASDGDRYFLVADACWGKTAFVESRPPNAIVRTFFSDWVEYNQTLQKIHHVHSSMPKIKIVPCHCDQTWTDLSHADH